MEEALMTQAQSTEERARLKKQWTDLSVKLAQEGQWEEAMSTNKNILNLFPFEPDALNRLGKAYSELGQYEESRQAYSQTLKYDPKNTIAQKNLKRLALLQEASGQGHTIQAHPGERHDENLTVDEPGKTGMTDLINVAAPAVLAKVGVGDKVQLHVNGHTLLLQNLAREVIGQVEPRLANRLISFMGEGNRYAATVKTMEQGQVRIRIREIYQHPGMFGKVSFPSQGSADALRERPDIRGSMLRYDRDDDDDLGNDDEYYDGGDETEEMNEVDIEGTTESEE